MEKNKYNKDHEVHNTPEGPKYFKSNHLNDIKIRFYGNMAVAQGDEIMINGKLLPPKI